MQILPFKKKKKKIQQTNSSSRFPCNVMSLNLPPLHILNCNGFSNWPVRNEKSCEGWEDPTRGERGSFQTKTVIYCLLNVHYVKYLSLSFKLNTKNYLYKLLPHTKREDADVMRNAFLSYTSWYYISLKDTSFFHRHYKLHMERVILIDDLKACKSTWRYWTLTPRGEQYGVAPHLKVKRI